MSNSTPGDLSGVDQDCAICLQICHHPTKLPCGHVFCFLCVKGVAIQSKKCAMCRAEIPSNYLDNPVLLEKLSPVQVSPDQIQNEYQWYYEGRNGWWKYDERSTTELELAFSNGEVECSLLLAGALYIIDFQSMTQVRRSDRTRRRRVRRDTPLFPAKGIAGIKTENRHIDLTKSEDDSIIDVEDTAIIEVVNEDEIVLDTVSESSPRVNDAVGDIAERLGVINLTDSDTPGG